MYIYNLNLTSLSHVLIAYNNFIVFLRVLVTHSFCEWLKFNQVQLDENQPNKSDRKLENERDDDDEQL